MRTTLLCTACTLLFACGGGDTDACKPLPDTKPTDLLSTPWVELQKPEGFCNVAAAYQYQIYKFGSAPTLLSEVDGFDGEMTFPADVAVNKLTGGGAEVQYGTQSGEVCGRHFNTCTPPGPFACQPITVVATDVFAPIRTDQIFYHDGAIAAANEAVWYMNPRSHPGVWRLDPATNAVQFVSAIPPGAADGSSDLTGGSAIGVGNDVWYLIDKTVFRFDTVAMAWQPAVAINHAASWSSASLASTGRLYVHQEGFLNQGGGFMVFDPATQQTSELAFSGFQRHDMVAFVRNGKLVFGGGNECDPRLIDCWHQDFKAYDVAADTWTAEPYSLPGGRELHATLDFDDRTLFLAGDGTVWTLLDSENTLKALPTNPALTSCVPKAGPPNAYQTTSIVYNGRGMVVGGEGADTVFTLYLP